MLIAGDLNVYSAAMAFACALNFRARLAHLVVYTPGIPVARTLAFSAGFLAQAIMVLAIFKLI